MRQLAENKSANDTQQNHINNLAAEEMHISAEQIIKRVKVKHHQFMPNKIQSRPTSAFKETSLSDKCIT